MSRFSAEAYALFRIVAGFLFLWHGCQKLFGFPLPSPAAPPLVIYLGGGIELIGGLLVMIGLQTRWAAFLCSGMMAAAYWLAHGTQHVLRVANKGELAVLYCFAFLMISARGAGRFSVDGPARGAGA